MTSTSSPHGITSTTRCLLCDGPTDAEGLCLTASCAWRGRPRRVASEIWAGGESKPRSGWSRACRDIGAAMMSPIRLWHLALYAAVTALLNWTVVLLNPLNGG